LSLLNDEEATQGLELPEVFWTIPTQTAICSCWRTVFKTTVLGLLSADEFGTQLLSWNVLKLPRGRRAWCFSNVWNYKQGKYSCIISQPHRRKNSLLQSKQCCNAAKNQ
jgi:hypothetical protein